MAVVVGSDQRTAALALAQDVRLRRARLKRDLAAGRRDLCEVLAEPPSWLEGARVFDLLLAVRKVGRVKAHKILARHGVTARTTVGGLGERRRLALVAGLGEWYPFDGRRSESLRWDSVAAG